MRTTADLVRSRVLELLQVLGAIAIVAGSTWLLGAWALITTGVALLVLPELATRRKP